MVLLARLHDFRGVASKSGVARFGTVVRRHRLARGMTIEQLAEGADLSPNYVGMVETGKKEPSLATVFAISRGLGVPPADLLGSPEAFSPVALEVARCVERMSEADQEAVLRIARSVVRRK